MAGWDLGLLVIIGVVDSLHKGFPIIDRTDNVYGRKPPFGMILIPNGPDLLINGVFYEYESYERPFQMERIERLKGQKSFSNPINSVASAKATTSRNTGAPPFRKFSLSFRWGSVRSLRILFRTTYPLRTSGVFP